MNKIQISAIVGIIMMFLIGALCFQKNNIQDIAILQSQMTGEITVVRTGGYKWAPFSRKWVYPKAQTYFFSKDKNESKEDDAPAVTYSNKGKGWVCCQVIYSINMADDNTIIKLHEFAHGDDDNIDRVIYGTIKDIAANVASTITSSDAIEKRTEFSNQIKQSLLKDSDLKKYGITIETFNIVDTPFDPKTTELFVAQQQADLMKKTAEAEKQKLVMEKERAVAQYEKEIAESEGKAKAQMAKEVTDAEREKKLAEISAQKQVEVAKLEKEKATIEVEKQKEVARIEAEKLFAVAEVQKKTEAENLEAIKLQAEQKIAEAEAKKIAIEKSGAITELQKAQIELDRQIAQYKWESIGKAIAGIKLPQMMTIGSGKAADGSVSPLDQLIQTLTLEKLNSVSASPTK